MDRFVSHEMRRKECKSGKRTFRIARAQANASPFEGVLLDSHDFVAPESEGWLCSMAAMTRGCKA
jgi:hypothetical protein